MRTKGAAGFQEGSAEGKRTAKSEFDFWKKQGFQEKKGGGKKKRTTVYSCLNKLKENYENQPKGFLQGGRCI